ncbi:MAG: sulfate adenylyltransferase [Planctomycetaceae bacterium]|jgi:sulfate adenylyltransferase|nr:sulfate adenylyltransferase [Planctomycetaceae bacterium]
MQRDKNQIEPHGGEIELVNCTVPSHAIESVKLRISDSLKVPVSDADLSTIYRFADGTLTPLDGPMNEDTFNRVLDESIIEINAKKYAWTIPISLPVTKENADKIKLDDEVAVVNSANEIVAALKVTSKFYWDKMKYLKNVYLTDRTDHPGADMVLKQDADKTFLLGGKIAVLPKQKINRYDKYILTPFEVRQLFMSCGWERVVAFQTRNPLHRAHEYALVYGLEELLRNGFNAGACLNPLVGETKSDDVSAEVRMKTYEALIENQTLGEGDKDEELWRKIGGSLSERVLLIGLDIKMFYAGPKEAVMHAIYRQNYGFTDLIIGRKHADAPYHDGTAIWGDFDAQNIFNNLQGELKIKPLKVGFAAYYESIGKVDLMDNHKDEKPVFISGKEIRKTLIEGKEVDPRIMRQSTSRILFDAMKQKN